MTNNIKVSVIIPIYGVEKFIERCARSLFTQTLREMEFIFVDDCTRDDSISVLNRVIDDYPERKSQVFILKHEKNKGLAQARKTGIKVAKGKYVAHCDSDDWVEPDMYRMLYERAEEESADIVCCNFYKTDGLHIKDEVHILPTHHLLTGPVWNKLTKRELYDNEIIYPTAGKAEDGALMVQLSYYSKKVVYVNQPLYNYFQNPDSICRVMTEDAMLKRLNEEISNTEIRIEFLKKHNVLKRFKSDVIGWKRTCRSNLYPYYHKRKYRKMWRNTYPEINWQLFLDSRYGFMDKVIFFMDLVGLRFCWTRIKKYLLR